MLRVSVKVRKIGVIVNVIVVARNINRSRPLVINYSLLISGQFFKRELFERPVE